MPKCEITLRHGCSPVNLLHIFRTPFTRNTSGWLLLELWKNLKTLFRDKTKTYSKVTLTLKNKIFMKGETHVVIKNAISDDFATDTFNKFSVNVVHNLKIPSGKKLKLMKMKLMTQS